MKHDGIFRIAPQGGVSIKGNVAAMGMKAFGLSRMARLGLPVPPAFVLGTNHCRLHNKDPERYGKNLAGLLEEQLHWLQSVTGLVFGDTRKPLLVSVRSGAPVSMPGMMDTLLNIGLCDATVHGLLRTTGNPRLVWDSYRRLVQDFAETVYSSSPQPFAEALDEMLARERLEHFQDLDYLSLAELTQTYLQLFAELTGRPFPQDPLDQLGLAVQAVLASSNSPRAIEYRRLYGLPKDLCTAVIIQQMVFGNAGGTSGSGVGFTRDPDTGEKKLYFEFLFNSQGEDIVSGRTASSDAENFSGHYRKPSRRYSIFVPHSSRSTLMPRSSNSLFRTVFSFCCRHGPPKELLGRPCVSRSNRSKKASSENMTPWPVSAASL